MIEKAVDVVRQHIGAPPNVAVILGSGLGAFTSSLTSTVEVPYAEIPGWPASTAQGHAGKLVIGQIGGMSVAAAGGRAHLYEGYSGAQVAFGIRVLEQLGVEKLIITNAAGAIHPDFKPGDLVLVSDHLNLQGTSPLTGPEFVDLTEAYSARWRQVAQDAARGLGLDLSEGVYAALRGPHYETPAEIRYLRTIGADLVGMSTVQEVIAARALGMEVLAVSCVTNTAAGLGQSKLAHEEVLEVGRSAQGKLTKLLKALLSRL